MGPFLLEKRWRSRRGRSKKHVCMCSRIVFLSRRGTIFLGSSVTLSGPEQNGRDKNGPPPKSTGGTPVQRNAVKQNTSTTLHGQNTSWDRNAKNSSSEWIPSGGTTGVVCTPLRSGHRSRIELYSWFADCFHWLTMIRDTSFGSCSKGCMTRICTYLAHWDPKKHKLDFRYGCPLRREDQYSPTEGVVSPKPKGERFSKSSQTLVGL